MAGTVNTVPGNSKAKMTKTDEALKILVVDDVPANLSALTRVLDGIDAEVITAISGSEALSLALTHEFALILLDVMMPVMDGFEAAELLRGEQSTRHIPIIFITAINKEEKYIFKGYEAGAVDYLFKPVDSVVLRSKVQVFLDLARQKKQLEDEITRRKELERRNEQVIDDLQKALDKVKVLSGFLPICASCKKIRDDQGYWNQIESYITEHSEALFTHSSCPDCTEKLYAKYMKKKNVDKDPQG